MSFDDEVVKPGRGRCFRVDISTDNFATIAYRYSDVAGALDGTNEYEPRVLEVGAILRSFGQNRIAASPKTSLKLANADGAADWICGRENIATAAAARFRIYVVLYDKTAATPTFTEKRLGEFVLSAWPAQDDEVVMLQLGDDFMGKLGAGLVLPTLNDWRQVGDASNNPFANSIGLPSSISLNTPVQLAFGEDMLLAFPTLIPWGNNGTGEPYEHKIIVPLYSTTDLSAVSQDLVSEVRFEAYNFDVDVPGTRLYTLPRTGYATPDDTEEPELWRVEKSPTITKEGREFQIVYLVIDEALGIDPNIDIPLETSNPVDLARNYALLSWLRTFAYAGGYPTEAVDSTKEFPYYASRVTKWYVRASPKSQITNAPNSIGFGISHPVDVLIDLVTIYSDALVDPQDWPRVKAGMPFAACSGVVHAWTERANNPSVPPPPMSLRQVLTDLAQSSDIDIFVKWNGVISVSSDVYDFTTATQAGDLVEFREEDISNVLRWTPSDGERGAPFNTLFFTGGKPDPVSHQEVPFQGPFTITDADIPPSTRVLEAELRQGWRPFRQQSLDPVKWRAVDGVCRDRIRFTTNISGLRLELGKYFKVTWTRGPANAPVYEATIFQCEGIGYSPDGDVVEIEGIWRDDTVTERQYLLDDETLLVRSKGALSGSLTESGDDQVWWDAGGSINFGTMGIEQGDILVLRDTTEAADAFNWNYAVRIVDIPSATRLEVAASHTDTGHSVTNTDWYIVRGATTYHTAVSDPTNYPSGGEMYGKVTDSGGEYSDEQTGNRLISG